MDNKSNNKRIAKNTFALYIRMLFVMAISLYTVRVVLRALGEVDYGIYNVVGGVVLMFSFLNSSLASASQRFFAFEIGKNDKKKLKRTFSSMLFFYISICVILFIAVEIFGFWFLNNKLNIPEHRMDAANWVFQFSVIAFLIRMINTPFQALIIAYEKMSVYAIVGMVEVVLQLLLVFGLRYFGGDCLILYSIFTTANILVISLSYIIYCLCNFSESSLTPLYEKSLAHDIIKYSGWMMMYGFSEVFYVQGINMLLNIFFSAAINSARAIAYQVYGAIKLFGVNFFKAVEPQLTKQYAQDNYTSAFSLLEASSKLSYYLILVLSIPVITNASYILELWLGDVPDNTVVFTQLMLIDAMVGIIGNPLGTLSRATGKIGKYSFVISILYLSNMPVSYICLKLGCSATSVFVVMIILCVITIIARILMLKEQITTFSIKSYTQNVCLPIAIVSLVSMVCYYIFCRLQIFSFLQLVLSVITQIIIVITICFFLGLNNDERALAKNMLTKILRK